MTYRTRGTYGAGTKRITEEETVLLGTRSASGSKKSVRKEESQFGTFQTEGSGWGADGVFRPDEVKLAYIEKRAPFSSRACNCKVFVKTQTRSHFFMLLS